MADTVKVPVAGKVKTGWLIAGGGALVLLAYYVYSRRAAQPALGEGEATPGDQWSPDAFQGATTPGGETFDPQDISPDPNAPPATNAQWFQRVVDWLVNVSQYEPQFASETIGKYLSGNALNAGEKLLVQTGIGALGSPPAGALPIISAPEPTAPPATTTKLARPVIQVQAGDPRNTLYNLISSKIPGAIGYLWQRTAGPGAPTSFMTPGPKRVTPPLRRGSHYSYRVKAIAPPGKTSSDWSNTASFTVPKR